MVTIRPKAATELSGRWRQWMNLASILLVSTGVLYIVVPPESTLSTSLLRQNHPSSHEKPQVAFLESTKPVQQKPKKCPYTALADLAPDELHPSQGERHMITPPAGGNLTLVCCRTTQGPWNILVHTKWAPHGANRFLSMVRANYFQATVPLMRCVKRFLCQFGLNSDPSLTKRYNRNIPDDVPWLPRGPKYRQNDQGVKRFARGYLAYAGAGPSSRSNQFIVALEPNGPLAGGSPWEVPWGELVGRHSYTTLDQIYTGYGEDGPPQGTLHKEGASEQVQSKWPLLDYIKSCDVVDEMIEL